MTAPTTGFGRVVPRPRAASASARRMRRSSVGENAGPRAALHLRPRASTKLLSSAMSSLTSRKER